MRKRLKQIYQNRMNKKQLRAEAWKILRSPSKLCLLMGTIGILEARKELPEVFGEWTETDEQKLEQTQQMAKEIERLERTIPGNLLKARLDA